MKTNSLKSGFDGFTMLSFWEEGAANILGSENRHYIIIVFLVIEELAEIHASYCLHFF